MNAQQKKDLVVKALGAFLTGDAEASARYLADDASWWICSSLAGHLPSVDSKAKIIERNSGIGNTFPEGLKTTVHEVYCDGDTVIVEFSNLGTAANGRTYSQDYCVVFKLEGDKIKQIREHQDSLHVHETFFV